MIVVTGAAGFVGSVLIGKLNAEGYNDVVAVDDFSSAIKNKNLEGKKLTARIDRQKFFDWLKRNNNQVQFIFHIGARTDTAEFNMDVLNALNLDYSKKVWEACVRYGLPLVYASSAATYGAGELGYSDKHALSFRLQPLNPYGISKNEFDKWALRSVVSGGFGSAQPDDGGGFDSTQPDGSARPDNIGAPYFWAGLKFFNVYGPNEYHKDRMASVIFHAFRQIKETGRMKLFRSHRTDFTDGGQQRDFVYVKDVVDVLFFLMHHRKKHDSGIYNLGTGKARTFLDLAHSTFSAMGIRPDIQFIDTPADIRDKYQYFTEANMSKLRSIGYTAEFTSLEEGIKNYVQDYLIQEKYY